MAIYPEAVVKLIPKWNKRRMVAYNRVMLHVAVSEAASLYNFFSGSKDACSHFYVRRDGTVEQYIDTAYQSAAEVDASDASISIESQGGVHNPNGEEWTPQQAASIARIILWSMNTHGVPRKLATSSRYGVESQGVAWHRLGVTSSPPGLPGYRKNGPRSTYMLWSGAVGKACPGTAKINQIPGIFSMAVGGNVPAPSPSPSPAPAPAPAPVKRNPHGRPLLAEDGWLGQATITELQHVLGTTPDGVISVPRSNLTAALQERLIGLGYNIEKDGAGLYTNVDGANKNQYNTVGALQAALGSTVDYRLSAPSDMVRKMQRLLNEGKFLESLKPAPASWKRVNSSPAPAPAVPNPPAGATAGKGVMKRGSKGQRVKNLQNWLNASFPAYSKLTADGSYGPATEAVVKEFQRRAKGDGAYHGAVDGIWGPGTNAAGKHYGWQG